MKHSISATIICFILSVLYAYFGDDILLIGFFIFGGVSFICGAVERGFKND